MTNLDTLQGWFSANTQEVTLAVGDEHIHFSLPHLLLRLEIDSRHLLRASDTARDIRARAGSMDSMFMDFPMRRVIDPQ